MIRQIITMQFMIFCGTAVFAQNMTARQILDKSIQYHDPKNQWNTFDYQLEFISERPNGPDRQSKVAIDNTRGKFSLIEENNNMEILMDSCILVPSNKTCDQVKTTRNYYIYLWGLPMKLKDEGTSIDSKIGEEKFDGADCYVLRVPYDDDVWFFYIDVATYAMRGYMFYKDEPNKKGEVIYLTEEEKIGNMRIPKKRKWVTMPDLKFLGTDILTSSN